MNQTTTSYFQSLPTDELAKDLLGRTLTYQSPQGLVGGLIVETESYMGPTDFAAHSYNNRRTNSNEGLYKVGGSIYIYAQRQYFFFDIATQEAGNPEGILIRAIEPTIGLDIMNQNRKMHGFELTNGPAKMMQAFGIKDKSENLKHLDDSQFKIDLTKRKIPQEIIATPRIGVKQQDEFWANAPFRFIVDGNPYVSRIKKAEIDLQNFGWN